MMWDLMEYPNMSQRLSALFVKRVSEPGKYHDGHGLILRVKPTGSKQWVQRLVVKGRRRDIGLGGYPLTSLVEAREAAFTNRKLARAGGDPLRFDADRTSLLSKAAAETVIALHAENWKDSGRTVAIWESSLRRYAFPRLGHRLVSDITVAEVMAVLVADDFWNRKRASAMKIRRRISTIMRWTVAAGFRENNPAGEVLGAALPKSTKPVKHHRALPHAAVAGALETVRGSGAGIATKLAIEFLTLTATRSSEVRLGTWSEVDLEEAVWRVPAERTKTKRTHEVPLSGRTAAILAEALEIADGSGLIFPSPRGKTLSDNTLSKLFRELGIGAVPHGARSSFRSWCADTGIDREVAEACLAHVVGGVEGAYQRSTMYQRRREVMEAWANYLTASERGRVIPMVRPHG